MTSISTEICIVGAGPAGATTSLFLSKMGISHLILDAATFPRDKICGDGLDLKVLRVLRQFDPELIGREIFGNPDFIPSWGARIITANGRHTDFYHTPEPGRRLYPPLWTAKRLHFDHFLVKHLDPRFADFRPGTKVAKVRREGGGWVLEATNGSGQTVTVHTRLLVGADGDHSVVLRALGERSIDRRHYAGTLRQYWRGIRGFHPQNLIELYFPKGLPLSYFYMFPLPGGEANVGYGMVSDLTSRGKFNLREIFQRLIHDDPVIAPRFEGAEPLEQPIGWGIPLASRRRPASGDGYLLVGDAASLVCPTSGEGIGTGMISGYVAAHFIRRALEQKRTDAAIFRQYDREIYRRLNQEIRVYNFLRRYAPMRLYDWGLNTFTHRPVLQRYFQGLIGQWLETAYEKDIAVRVD